MSVVLTHVPTKYAPCAKHRHVSVCDLCSSCLTKVMAIVMPLWHDRYKAARIWRDGLFCGWGHTDGLVQALTRQP